MEMWPKGDEAQAFEFGRCIIANDGSKSNLTSGVKGDYSVSVYGGVANNRHLVKHLWKRGIVVDFNRATEGGWHLLARALQSILRLK